MTRCIAFAGLGIALLLAACDKNQVTPTNTAKGLPVSISPTGRYQIIVSPGSRADTFLIDTQKGKVWAMTQITDVADKPSLWMPMTVIDRDRELGPDFVDWFTQQRALSDLKQGKK